MSDDSNVINNKKVFDLTEVYEEKNGRGSQEVIVVDGRGYQRKAKDSNYIHELVDVAEESSATGSLNEEILQRVTEIAERIAREVIPGVAERVIHEEIDKLKKLSENESTTVN